MSIKIKEKTYAIKEIFYTLQGEGFHAGRPAVFLRFSGCNLWSGLEKDREKAICKFCDTDFWGTDGTFGGKYTATELAQQVTALWPKKGWQESRFVVCTGGEPMLQMDEQLVDQLHNQGFEIAIETNGTIAVPRSIDWICVSPKQGSEVVQKSGDELKLVHPQTGYAPKQFEDWDFNHFLLQPMDGPLLVENTKICLNYCMQNPLWKLSVQTHKVLGIR
ncbi:MAG: 7-carboxy-7-deazaguanine synthase [Saprospirales bacterium]|nr:MAG: 7-carboxy-7-deazaguanine synthase [Saprospirales bacterium]